LAFATQTAQAEFGSDDMGMGPERRRDSFVVSVSATSPWRFRTRRSDIMLAAVFDFNVEL